MVDVNDSVIFAVENGDKFGFVPGLSVMDLLFNEGPESICFLG